MLGKAFTWTCDMFVPPGYSSNAIRFYRNNKLCVLIENTNTSCATQSDNCGYSYKCLSESMFSLTIPAENMTEYENRTTWRCDYDVAGYASPQVFLNIASKKFKIKILEASYYRIVLKYHQHKQDFFLLVQHNEKNI